MAKFDVTKNVVVPRGEYDDMVRNGYALARLEREHEQAQAKIEELTQSIDFLNRDKIEAMAEPKPTAEITPRPRAELIQAIRRAHELAGRDAGLHGEAAVNALTHRLFVTGTTTIRERLSRETILAALRDAGIHPLAPEPRVADMTVSAGHAQPFFSSGVTTFIVSGPENRIRPGDRIEMTRESTPCQHFAGQPTPNDEFVSFDDDAALIKWGRENELHFVYFKAAPAAKERLIDESRLQLRRAMLNPPAKQAAPGAFLSIEEDRELVAMGREIYDEWDSSRVQLAAPLGALSTSLTINFKEPGYWPTAFAPTPANPEHLTDPARALLRRVRDERKSTTPKEGTDDDAN